MAGAREATVEVQKGRLAETQKKTKLAEKIEKKAENVEWRAIDEKYSNQYKSAKKMKEDFSMMRQIDETGKIRHPNATALYKALGVNDFGRNFATQAIDKLASGIIMEDIKGLSGKAATVFAEQIGAKARPGLLNDPNTIDTLAAMGENAQEYAMVEAKAFLDFAKKHKDELVPPDINSEVQMSPEVQMAAENRERKNRLLIEFADAREAGRWVASPPPAKNYQDWKQLKKADGTFLTKLGGKTSPKWYSGFRQNAKNLTDRI